MTSITSFDDLSDLFFIELFNYLSPVDILWSLINLNNRIRTLINERGFFRHINLSSTRLFQFDTLLALLPLDRIETLVIDTEASPLQLSRWPHLPRLTTLRLYGLREYETAPSFILRHSHSLQQLTLQTNDLFISVCILEDDLQTGTCQYFEFMTIDKGGTGCQWRPEGCLGTLVENVLPHLNALRSLELGQETGLGITNWCIQTIQCPLNYFRAPMSSIKQLCELLSVESLSTTLERLHVTIRNLPGSGDYLPEQLRLSPMIHLHSFTFAQSMFSDKIIEWSNIDFLTSSDVMPSLRQINLVLFIIGDDLYSIKRSALFTDYRQVDVQFAFIMVENFSHIELNEHLLQTNRAHRREIVHARCLLNFLIHESLGPTNLNRDFNHIHQMHYDVWYTLPWMFEQFFELFKPFGWITKVETVHSSLENSSTIYPSRLRSFPISHNDCPPSIISMPHVVQLDRIHTVHLAYHDWPTALNLPSLRHLILTNNLIALKSFASFPRGIRSIQIFLHPFMPNHVSNNWSVLRSLSALPMLTSLHIVLNDISTGLDKHTCHILAETVPMLVHFGICFRRRMLRSHPDTPISSTDTGPTMAELLAADPDLIVGVDDDVDSYSFLESIFDEYRMSIEEIHHRILCLPLPTKPLIVVEEEGCGLTAWL